MRAYDHEATLTPRAYDHEATLNPPPMTRP